MPSWLKQTAAALVLFTLLLTRPTFPFFLSLFIWLLPQVFFQNEIWLWQFITAKLILWVEQWQARFRRTELKYVRTNTDTYVWTRTHNKVPGCSVYIIVFEMVMHEPVNQLAADKRAGLCPESPQLCSCVCTCTQHHKITSILPWSNIFYYILFSNVLTFLFLLLSFDCFSS